MHFGWLFKRVLLLSILFTALTFSAAANVVLAEKGKSRWQVHCPSTNAVEKFAVAELQRYFAQISECQLPLSKKVNSKRTIVVALRSELSPENQALLPAPHPGYDGYAIAISEKPERIIIAGDNSSGLIYGVYDFLEHLGCRWFYPTQNSEDPEVVPRLSHVSLATNAWTMASPIRYRICNGSSWYFQMDYSAAKKQLDWGMKNRYNAVGWQAAVAGDKKTLLEQYQELGREGVLAELEKRGMFIHGPAHSFDHFLSSEQHFKEHPEWFGMRDGKRVPQSAIGAQFCWSNPEARQEFAKNAAAFITQAPLIHIFCTIPFDGGVACTCDECKKIGSSDLLMKLLGDVIERVKASRPDVLVETVGGYGAVPEPPSNLDIIHPQQRVVWAQWGRHHGIGYDDPKYDRRNLDNWRKAAKGGLTICQYYTDNFAEPWVMGPFAIAMESDRKYFLKHKVDAMYMLMYSPGYWWNHSLNGYIGGRSYYDVSIDPFAEIRDYATNYFGPKAGPFLADYYTEWAKNIELSYRVRGDARKQDRVMLAAERKKFIQPAVKASSGDATISARVRKVEQLHTLAELLAEMHRQHDVVLILRQKGKFDEASRMLKKAEGQSNKVMEKFYALADLQQGLIDRKEVAGFITMAVKNWLETEAKAIAAKDTVVPPNPWKNLAETELLPGELVE
ncbi:MAG: hypothetical protein JWM68_3157 [Verrucomicrobiales bacterium]|nr:hypothetical protein [Verrucomicrobiales bacterium]